MRSTLKRRQRRGGFRREIMIRRGVGTREGEGREEG
jgi:hypothetical protein